MLFHELTGKINDALRLNNKETKAMKCPSCRGLMYQGKTHILVKRDNDESIIVINNVPALICEQCGDDFINISITRKIEELLAKLESEGLKMGFVDYSRAA